MAVRCAWPGVRTASTAPCAPGATTGTEGRRREGLRPARSPLLPVRADVWAVPYSPHGKRLPRLRRRGWKQSCAIARCSLSHGGVEYCWQCGEYPCQRYKGFYDYDSFLPARSAPRDIQRFQEMGPDAFRVELDAKAEILEELLGGYNAGRKKTFFCTAVNLLPLPDLQAVMAEIRAASAGLDGLPEREAAAVGALTALAQRQGVSLSLRKKPRAKP